MSAGRSTRMLKTLVVDDSPTMRRMVMASLREVCAGGFLEAASGLEAIEQLALGPVALIVLDLNMPDMHGLEVLKFVRSHQRVPRAARSSCSRRAATRPAAPPCSRPAHRCT